MEEAMTLQISTDEFMRRYGEMMDEGVRSGTADAEALAGMFAEYFVGSVRLAAMTSV